MSHAGEGMAARLTQLAEHQQSHRLAAEAEAKAAHDELLAQIEEREAAEREAQANASRPAA